MCQNSVCKFFQSKSLCSTCRNRDHAEKNALAYTYRNLKHNAKRRGKDFSLTKEEWKEFCDTTGYLALRGTTAQSMTVDRIRDEIGYQRDNIQMLTLRENRLKKKTYAKYVQQEGDPF